MKNLILQIIFILITIAVYSQNDIPNVDTTNFQAKYVSIYIENQHYNTYHSDVMFSFRDTMLYTTSPSVFKDIFFIKDWRQYTNQGTTFKQNLGHDEGNFKVQVSIAQQDPNISPDGSQPWFIYIAYEDLQFYFHAHSIQDSVMKKEIKMHEMYKKKYTEGDIQWFITKFGPLMNGGE